MPDGAKFIVTVKGKTGGRSGFVEHRHYLTPWRHQARQFDSRDAAET